MLSPAHVGHLPALRSLIREGASEGSFSARLAHDTPESRAFFASLKQALASGYFVVEDARGVLSRSAVPGYVYWGADGSEFSRPVGFGLFRAFADAGYELWLAGISAASRGIGHGRSLLSALLGTTAGRLAWIVGIGQASGTLAATTHLLGEFRYRPVHDTATTRWFLRDDAPAWFGERVREGSLKLRGGYGER